MPKYRGVEGGTPTGEPLCRTCRRAHIIKGLSISDAQLWCSGSGRSEPLRMKFEAYECTEYDDKRLPMMYQMEELAWVFKTDVKTKQIGFVPPRSPAVGSGEPEE